MDLSSININECVYVIPNENTLQCVFWYYDNVLYPSRASQYNEDDASTWMSKQQCEVDGTKYIKLQLHELMNMFGPSVYMGSRPAFKDNEIYFDPKSTKGSTNVVNLLAEFDNFRRRTDKEKADLVDQANANLMGKLIEVYDDFDFSFKYLNHWGSSSIEFLRGLYHTVDKFKKIMSDNGLEQFDPTGTEFNPNEHEAINYVPSFTVPEGHVIEVLQKGYQLNGKVIRVAKVSVAKRMEDVKVSRT